MRTASMLFVVYGWDFGGVPTTNSMKGDAKSKFEIFALDLGGGTRGCFCAFCVEDKQGEKSK